jgi:hypothetical protein
MFGHRRFSIGYWVDMLLAGVVGIGLSELRHCYSEHRESAKRTETFQLQLNKADVGYPREIFAAARRENPALTLTFEPPSLEEVRACEYYDDTQESFKRILDRYFAKYSDCFDVVQTGELHWVVKPNRKSGKLRSIKVGSKEQFGCLCSPAQMK